VGGETLTVISDIDVLVCLRSEDVKRRGLLGEILWRAVEKFGLQWDYPVEIHIVKASECTSYLKRPHLRVEEV